MLAAAAAVVRRGVTIMRSKLLCVLAATLFFSLLLRTRGWPDVITSRVVRAPRQGLSPSRRENRRPLGRARCFSGMRWSGCGTGLQHPSNRSCVLFVDARQHRDRAWYIEAIYDPFAANDRALRRVGFCPCNARQGRQRGSPSCELGLE